MATERGTGGLAGRWLTFWFAPEAARTLGLCRIAFYGLLLLYYWTYDFSVWATAPAGAWAATPPFLLLGLPHASRETLVVLQLVWKGALLLACLGLATRFATATVFLLGVYLIGYLRSIAMNHSDAVLIIVLGALAVARCGDACSLDARFAGRAAPPSGEYRWPLQLVRIMALLPLFAGGLSKLRHAGPEWVFSDTLAIVLLQNHLRSGPLLPWGTEIARYVWLCQLLAAGALVLELLLPLAFVGTRARIILVPAAALLLVSFRLLLGPNFAPLLICYSFWVPWEQLGRRLAALGRSWRGALRVPLPRRRTLAR